MRCGYVNLICCIFICNLLSGIKNTKNSSQSAVPICESVFCQKESEEWSGKNCGC